MSSIVSGKALRETVGYRFHPTDAELVGHFLNRKILDNGHDDRRIAEVKVCDFEPWDLRVYSKIKSEDQTWYFFCALDLKYVHSRRVKRTTKLGFWKPTGKVRKVKSTGQLKKVIGTKRTLVFYIKAGHPKPIKSEWIMHEYQSIPQGNFVVCKLKTKSETKISKCTPNEMASPSPPPSPSRSPSPAESVVTDNLSCGEFEPSDHMNPDLAHLNVEEMTAMSTYDKDEQSCSMGFDFGSPDENEVTTSYAESELCPHLAFDLEGQTANAVAAGPASQNEMFSREGKLYFKCQNPDRIGNIVDSEKGEWISLVATPDCGSQDLHEKTNMSMSSLATGVEINPLEASFLEVQGPRTFFDDLKAFIGSECSPKSAYCHQ